MLDSKKYYFFSQRNWQILHGSNFGGQLLFDKVLFANVSYGLYRLKCPKIQFFLWKIQSQV